MAELKDRFQKLNAKPFQKALNEQALCTLY